jgi:hypothetical protein
MQETMTSEFSQRQTHVFKAGTMKFLKTDEDFMQVTPVRFPGEVHIFGTLLLLSFGVILAYEENGWECITHEESMRISGENRQPSELVWTSFHCHDDIY